VWSEWLIFPNAGLDYEKSSAIISNLNIERYWPTPISQAKIKCRIKKGKMVKLNSTNPRNPTETVLGMCNLD